MFSFSAGEEEDLRIRGLEEEQKKKKEKMMLVTVITTVTIPGVKPQGTGDDTCITDTALTPISNGTPRGYGITGYGVD